MSSTLVSARGIGKRYRLGGVSPRLSLRDALTDLVRGKRNAVQDFWALRGVDFELRSGEVLGVIGPNGAGKSTLLKILSEITEPTEGEAHLFGRVSGLLELGVGFHSELTGRENVFLNGAILGMSRAEIRRKFDAIVSFAEIGTYIDTPVKHYSSGMFVRLGFAVAAHLESEVLIVDEVLAVGDAAFQRKCIGMMDRLGAEGRAVIIVSHNMNLVSQLCDRALLIERGSVVEDGPAAGVVSRYLAQGLSGSAFWQPLHAESEDFVYHFATVGPGAPSGEASPPSASDHREADPIPANAAVAILLEFSVLRKVVPGRLFVSIAREDGLVVLTSSSTDAETSALREWSAGHQRLTCIIPPHLLAPGRYFVTFSEPHGAEDILHRNALSFTISEAFSVMTRDRRHGVVAPILEWQHELD